MDEINVFLDTNVFINSKYDFNRYSLLNLKKYCDNGIVTLFTNDIVIREVKKHINSDVTLLAQQAKNAIKNYAELENALTVPVSENIKSLLLNAPANLINNFDKFIENAVILSNEYTSVIDLFNDYFDLNAPFESKKDKKSEFPDAAIIMSIKHYISSVENITLHVVTDDKGWHNAFKEISNIIMHKNIKSFLTFVSKEQEIYKNLVSFVDEEIEKLESKTIEHLCDYDWNFAVESIDICVECDDIEEVNVKDINLVMDGIEYIDSTEEYAIATVSGVGKVEIEFSYIDHSDETYNKEDHVWYNTKYGRGIVEVDLPIHLSLTIYFSDKDSDIGDIEFNKIVEHDIDIIDYKLKENIDYMCEPYFDICPDCGNKIGLSNDGGNGFCINCAPNH